MTSPLPLRAYTPWHHPYDWRPRPDGALELVLWRDGPDGRTCDVAVWYAADQWGLVLVGRVTRAARSGRAQIASWGAVERLPLCRSRHEAAAALAKEANSMEEATSLQGLQEAIRSFLQLAGCLVP